MHRILSQTLCGSNLKLAKEVIKMVIIKVIDGALYQWETGRAISIKPGPMHTVDEVHYMNPRGDTAYVVEPVTKDGEVIAPIPNILLQEAIDIRAFAVMHTETGDKVVADGTFGVNARQRPSDYVYTEIEFRTYEALADRIEALEKNRMPADAVLFVPQSLNPDQQEQARKNIGAASNDEVPSALPNPEKLTFEGAVSVTYDGSSPVVVNIPKGGSGVHVGSEPPADPSVNVWIDPEGGDGDLDLTIPDTLPNPHKLTFAGIPAEYDGSAPVSVTIPTKTSDLKNDSGYVTSVPGALPNPHKLTFTGAVTGEYDGSQAVTVALPEVMTVELTQSNGTYTANKTQQEILAAYEAGQEVRCIEGSMVLPLVQCHVGFCAFACVYNTKLYSVLIKATDNSVTMTVTDASASGSMDLSGYIPAPETAAVGQTVVVKAVDETGKPTQWEAVDMASGGTKTKIITFVDITAETDIVIAQDDTDTLSFGDAVVLGRHFFYKTPEGEQLRAKRIFGYIRVPSDTTLSTITGYYGDGDPVSWVHGDYIGNDQGFAAIQTGTVGANKYWTFEISNDLSVMRASESGSLSWAQLAPSNIAYKSLEKIFPHISGIKISPACTFPAGSRFVFQAEVEDV